jgi:hypothetical protein
MNIIISQCASWQYVGKQCGMAEYFACRAFAKNLAWQSIFLAEILLEPNRLTRLELVVALDGVLRRRVGHVGQPGVDLATPFRTQYLQKKTQFGQILSCDYM